LPTPEKCGQVLLGNILGLSGLATAGSGQATESYYSVPIKSKKTITDDGCVLQIRLFPDDFYFWLTVTRRCGDELPDLVSERSFTSENLATQAYERESQKLDQSHGASTHYQFAPGQTPAEPPKVPNLTAPQDAAAQATPLWVVQNQWNLEWEQRYAQWVTSEVDNGFFLEHGIATDCADVVYAVRWIFARQFGLPVKATIDGDVAFTQNSKKAEWASLPTAEHWAEDQRFRAALEYLMKMTYTRTLPDDTVPVAINEANLKPGIIYLTLSSVSGHAQLLSRVDPKETPFLRFVSSTVPREVRELDGHGFWVSRQPTSDEGFRRFVWPHLTKKSEMPGYSTEQYKLSFLRKYLSFSQAVFDRLGVKFDLVRRFSEGTLSMEQLLTERSSIVVQAQQVCGREGACPPGSRDEDSYSTHSRDRRMRELLQHIDLIASECQFRGLDQCDKDRQRRIEVWTMNNGEQDMSVGVVTSVLRAGLIDSEATSSISARWGTDVPALVAKIVSRKEYLQKKRQEIINQHTNAGAPCEEDPERCAPGSENFRRWTTASIDIELLRLAEFRDNYCLFAWGCASLDSLLKERGLDLELESLRMLASDPRTGYQQRTERIALIKTTDASELARATQVIQAHWPKSRVTDIAPVRGHWLVYSRDRVGVVLAGNQKTEIEQSDLKVVAKAPAKGEIRWARWVGESIVLIERSDYSMLVDAETNKKLGLVEVPDSSKTHSPCLWFAVSEQIYDCTQGYLRRGAVDQESLTMIASQNGIEHARITGLIGADARSWYVEVKGCIRVEGCAVDHQVGYVRVNKRTGAATEFFATTAIESQDMAWFEEQLGASGRLSVIAIPEAMGTIAVYETKNAESYEPVLSKVVDPWLTLWMRRNAWGPHLGIADRESKYVLRNSESRDR